MMIGGHGRSRSLAFGVCLHSFIVLCLLSCYTPLFSSLAPWCERFTASGMKFMDFYGDFYCFLIYISRLLVVIFETWLYSLPYFYDITSIVSSSDSCGSCYSHSLQSSSRRLRLTF